MGKTKVQLISGCNEILAKLSPYFEEAEITASSFKVNEEISINYLRQAYTWLKKLIESDFYKDFRWYFRHFKIERMATIRSMGNEDMREYQDALHYLRTLRRHMYAKDRPQVFKPHLKESLYVKR